MTGGELRDARRALGEMWGIDRPLHSSELGRALRMRGKNVGETVLSWERSGPTGPASVAIELMLAGAMPPDPLDTIIIRTKL